MERSFFRSLFTLKSGFLLLIVLGLVVAGLLTLKAWWDGQVFQGYDPNLPLDAKEILNRKVEGHPVKKIEFIGLPGERIPVHIILPQVKSGERVPCVIFLYGIGQNARFFDTIGPVFASAGFALAMPEQFHRGERRKQGVGILHEALALRERTSRIVPETRRLVDLLSRMPEIDAERIALIGVSYGGLAASSVLAHEPRITSAALVMAGGNLPRLLGSMSKSLKPDSRVLAPAAASAAAWFFKPFEPLNYIAQVSPRPLLFLDLENDEVVDPACGEILFQTAREPKSRRLYGDSHNTISEETVRHMLNDVLVWLRAQQGLSG